MSEQGQQGKGVKTCAECGGTWPAERRHCLACGANLEAVPAQQAAEATGREPFNWAWLDAMAGEGPGSEALEAAEGQEKPGCLGRLFGA